MAASHKVNISSREPDDDGLVEIVVSRAQDRRRQEDADVEAQRDLRNAEEEASSGFLTKKSGQVNPKGLDEEWAYPSGGKARRYWGVYTYSRDRIINKNDPQAWTPYYEHTLEEDRHWSFSAMPWWPDGDPFFGGTAYTNPSTFSDPFNQRSGCVVREYWDKTYGSAILAQHVREDYFKIGSYVPNNCYAIECPDYDSTAFDLTQVREEDYQHIVEYNYYGNDSFLGFKWAEDFNSSIKEKSGTTSITVKWDWQENERYLFLTPRDTKFPTGYSFQRYSSESLFDERQWNAVRSMPFGVVNAGDVVMQNPYYGFNDDQHEQDRSTWAQPIYVTTHSPDGTTSWMYELYLELSMKLDLVSSPNWISIEWFANFPYSWDEQDWNHDNARMVYDYQYTLRCVRYKFNHAENTSQSEYLSKFIKQAPAYGTNPTCRTTQNAPQQSRNPEEPLAMTLAKNMNGTFNKLGDSTVKNYDHSTGCYEGEVYENVWKVFVDEFMWPDDPSKEDRALGFADDWCFDLANNQILATGIMNRHQALLSNQEDRIDDSVYSTSSKIIDRGDFYISRENMNYGRSKIKNGTPTGVRQSQPNTNYPPVPCAQVRGLSSGSLDLVTQLTRAQYFAEYEDYTSTGGKNAWTREDYFDGFQELKSLADGYDHTAHQAFTLRITVPGLSEMDPKERFKLRYCINNQPTNPYDWVWDEEEDPIEWALQPTGATFPSGTTGEIQFAPQDLEANLRIRRFIESWYTQCTPGFAYEMDEGFASAIKWPGGQRAFGFYYGYTNDAFVYDNYDCWDHETGQNFEDIYTITPVTLSTTGCALNYSSTYIAPSLRTGCIQFLANPIIDSGFGDSTLPAWGKVSLAGFDYTVVL